MFRTFSHLPFRPRVSPHLPSTTFALSPFLRSAPFSVSPVFQSSSFPFNHPPFFRFHYQTSQSKRYGTQSPPPPDQGHLVDPTPPEIYDPHHLLRVLFFAFFPFITFCLGTWQIFRWRRKLQLIQYRTDRISSPEETYTQILATRLPDQTMKDIGFHKLTQEQWSDLEFRPVIVDGVFEHEKQLLLKPRYHKNQVGSQVITPFVIEHTGERVLINRGWVRFDQEDAVPKIEGPVRVVCRPRISPKSKPNRWVAENNPESNQWFWTDVPQMAESTQTQPYLLDVVRTFSIEDKTEVFSPVPPPRPSELPNNHFVYICTWYGLTISLIFFSWPLYKRKKYVIITRT